MEIWISYWWHLFGRYLRCKLTLIGVDTNYRLSWLRYLLNFIDINEIKVGEGCIMKYRCTFNWVLLVRYDF